MVIVGLAAVTWHELQYHVFIVCLKVFIEIESLISNVVLPDLTYYIYAIQSRPHRLVSVFFLSNKWAFYRL